MSATAPITEMLGVRIDYTLSPVGTSVSEFVSVDIPWTEPPVDYLLKYWWYLLDNGAGHPILDEPTVASDSGTVTSSSGTIYRFGHPVPVKLRWDKVLKSSLDNSEISRVQEEFSIAAADASSTFSFETPGTDEYVVVENIYVVTPVSSTY